MHIEPGTLYIVATPIGNLADITSRAVATLGACDVVCCEDTRVTAKLLAHLGIQKRTLTLHQHSSDASMYNVMQLLEQGKNICLVTDAGTPGISDPGGKVVAAASKAGFTVTPIPGPSALVTALSVCGFPAERFTFLGFPPQKKGRAGFFAYVDSLEDVVVLYESTHRISKTLAELPKGRPLVLCRELTKLHETIYRGISDEVAAQLDATSTKGEFVIVLGPKHWRV